MITQAKWQLLQQRMKELKLFEKDLEEKFILGSGSGGQNLQKTSSCVFLRHNLTGIIIKTQKTRSREDNRFYARRLLCEKIAEEIFREKSEKQKAREKIRRQKRKRSKKAKEKMLVAKSQRGDVKKSRKKVTDY